MSIAIYVYAIFYKSTRIEKKVYVHDGTIKTRTSTLSSCIKQRCNVCLSFSLLSNRTCIK